MIHDGILDSTRFDKLYNVKYLPLQYNQRSFTVLKILHAPPIQFIPPSPEHLPTTDFTVLLTPILPFPESDIVGITLDLAFLINFFYLEMCI